MILSSLSTQQIYIKEHVKAVHCNSWFSFAVW